MPQSFAHMLLFHPKLFPQSYEWIFPALLQYFQSKMIFHWLLKVHPASFSILRSKGISHISTPIAGDVLTVLHNIFLVLWTEYQIFFSKDLVAKPYTMHPKSRTKQCLIHAQQCTTTSSTIVTSNCLHAI